MVTTANKIKECLLPHYDLFIASASYEKRCLSVINEIGNEISFGNKIVSVSSPHKDLFKENLELFKNKGFRIVEINNIKQIDTYSNLYIEINQVFKRCPKASLLIDISTFTKQTLLILIRLLRNIINKDYIIHFLYTPAKEYSIGLPYKDKWLSKGIIEVNSVFGYSGIIRPSRPYHLIILMGYEVERASSLISAYEPTKISVGYARQNDSISNEHFSLNKQKFDDLLSEFPYVESFEFSCIDVLDCKNDILLQCNKHLEYNIIISPMNNKISTISCALAAFDNNEIQLAIAIPALYNYQNYSIPGDSFLFLEIPSLIK